MISFVFWKNDWMPSGGRGGAGGRTAGGKTLEYGLW